MQPKIGLMTRLLVLIGVFVALFLRSPDLVIDPTLWSEDGVIFFKDAYLNGIESIFHPYAGYLHVITRLCAWISVTIFPLEILPTMFLFFSIAGTLYVANEYLTTSVLPRSVGVMGAFALVLVPHGGEVFLTLTNLHWILAALLPLLVLEPEVVDGKKLFVRSLLILLLGLNDPHVLIFFPFFCWRLWRFRANRMERVFFAIVAMTCLVQAWVTVSQSDQLPNPFVCPPGEGAKYWLFATIIQPVGMFLLGEQIAQMALHSIVTFAASGLVVFILLTFILIIYVECPKYIRKRAFIWLCFGWACYYSSLYRFWRTPNALVWSGASRYFYLLYVFSTVSISLCLFRRGVSRRNAIIGGLVLIAVFAGSVSGYRIPPREPVRWKEHMNELQEKGKTSVVISPGGEWVMTIDKRK